MRKALIALFIILGIVTSVFMFSSCSSSTASSSADSAGNYDYDDFNDDVDDWMKDQAEGKDYDYDDGGSYYCMGKGDSCNNKTRNAYDLYCSSCDPDGDNVEG